PGLRVDGQEPILERINRVRDRLLEELEPPGRFNVVQPARLATNGHGARVSRKGRDADILRIEAEAPTGGVHVEPYTVVIQVQARAGSPVGVPPACPDLPIPHVEPLVVA